MTISAKATVRYRVMRMKPSLREMVCLLLAKIKKRMRPMRNADRVMAV